MEGLSYLQSSVQNTVIACPQIKSFGRGGGHGGKDSINNDKNILKNQIQNLSGAQPRILQGWGDF